MSRWFSKKNESKPQAVQVGDEWDWNTDAGFVVIDLETTGLSPKVDRVLEIAMIQTNVQGEPLAYWSSLINPQGPVGATEIHGITDSDVADSPTFESIAEDVIARLKGHAVSAHNARFDLGFLKNEFARTGWDLPYIPNVCTMEASRHFLPDLTQRRLSDCAMAIGLEVSNAHRALSDASATVSLLNYYLRREASEGSPLNLRSLASSAPSVQWPLKRSKPIAIVSARKAPDRLMDPLDENLLEVLLGISADDLIDSDKSTAEFEYAELLIQALEDGQLTTDEAVALADLADSFDLDETQTIAIHMKLLSSLAHEAWRDGVITQRERRHIKTFAALLGFPDTTAKKVLDEVEVLRQEKLSSKSKALPEDWELGEPLRVGDRIVFTGCYELDRAGLERQTLKRGLRVTGKISVKTTLLVSDHTVHGNKAKDAEALNIRIVDPATLVRLLAYTQPAEIKQKIQDAKPSMEILTCKSCGNAFERARGKGRKPLECPHCRT